MQKQIFNNIYRFSTSPSSKSRAPRKRTLSLPLPKQGCDCNISEFSKSTDAFTGESHTRIAWPSHSNLQPRVPSQPTLEPFGDPKSIKCGSLWLIDAPIDRQLDGFFLRSLSRHIPRANESVRIYWFWRRFDNAAARASRWPHELKWPTPPLSTRAAYKSLSIDGAKSTAVFYPTHVVDSPIASFRRWILKIFQFVLWEWKRKVSVKARGRVL